MATKLTSAEINQHLQNYSTWKLDEKTNHLTKTFEFKTYFQGLAFLNAVAWLAQKHKHHPEMLLTYGKCKIDMQTHDVGGISDLDFTLVSEIEKIA